MKKYVWIVMCDQGEEYGGLCIVEVFDSEEKALACLESHVNDMGFFFISKRELK